MKNINEKKILSIDEAPDFIKEKLKSCFIKELNLPNCFYHTNRSYKTTASAIKTGLLSAKERAKLEKRDLTEREKLSYSDDCHVNGSEHISLAKIGLTDLYRDEFEYDPFSPHYTDILILGSVEAYRDSTNYGNEFLAKDKIDSSYFKSIDIRLLKLIEIYEKDNRSLEQLFKIIENYNYLKDIAYALGKKDILLREMSEESVILNSEKLIEGPKIYLRK